MNEEHKNILEMAYEVCEDESLEYTIQFMTDNLLQQSSTPIDEYHAHNKVIEYLVEKS